MKKRICSVLLVLVLTLVVLLPTAQAVDGGIGALGIQQISKTEYKVTSDVTEYEWLLNNSSLTQQMVGHVMEVKVGEGSTASIAAGYSDDDIDTIKTGRNWAMTKTTEQAQSMQTRRDTNVVGAINAGSYDMSNGRPSGAFIMSGTQINEPTATTFWIDASGNAHITDAQECNAAYAAGNVLEAVASFGDIFEDGHARSGLDNVTRASRTAIGIKADGTVVMFMVDGRQAPYSVGMTMAEVAAAMEKLGCKQAINLDGGGSSTFATQREGEPENSTSAGLTLRCRPSDGYERKVSNTIMVLSKATPTGQFDHAVLTPNDAVYTPGSTVQFEAKGVDAAGGSAKIPEGASWAVLSGGGRIDANGLLYTAGDTCGEVEVGLKDGDEIKGRTKIQVRWPDKLGFTNTSVSIDFGKTSDLTFNPTWQGRKVNYKNGDFIWSLDEQNLTYKYNVKLEEYYQPWWGAEALRWMPVGLLLTGTEKTGDMLHAKIMYDTMLLYDSVYEVTERKLSALETGRIEVHESLAHKTGTLYSYADPSVVLKENVTEDFAKTTLSDGKTYAIRNLSEKKDLVFSLGTFENNKYRADEMNSLRGKICVSTKDHAVTGSVDVVVGMEPYMLMDFEDHNGVSSKEYWTYHIGASSTGSHGELTADDVKHSRLWVRSNTGKEHVSFPGTTLVSRDEDDNVQYGQYAFKLGFNFGENTEENRRNNYAAELGFSGDLYVNAVQPTKLGFWVNVPADIPDGKDNTATLKAILKGGAITADLNTAYLKMDENGDIVVAEEGKQLNGTVTYFQYYGKVKNDAGQEITASTLGDLAGKGWVWMEADISALQMPVDVCRGYTVRISSAQNCSKGKGYIYVDSLQFIYGTNTNDVTNPLLESVIENGTQTMVLSDGTTKLSSGSLNFAVAYSDNEQTDKYASGIDQSGIRVLLDGVDYTATKQVEFSANGGLLYLKGMNLRNGTHTLTIRLKDKYGNTTTDRRSFLVEDEIGTEAGIAVLPQPEQPEVGKEYALWIVNQTGETLKEADLVIDIPSRYLTGAKIEELGSYTLTLDPDALAKGQAKIHISPKPSVQMFAAQSVFYEYESEIGMLVLTMPEDASSDSQLKYTITKGEYTTIDQSGKESRNSFSGVEQQITLTAEYKISCSQAVAGLKVTISVTDANGTPATRMPVYCNDVLIGKTDLRGQRKYVFTSAGTYTLHAADEKGSSWKVSVEAAAQTQENDGKPFGIQINGTEQGDTTRSITWLTSIGSSQAKAAIRLSTQSDMAVAEIKNGSSEILVFQKDALRSNCVYLDGLTTGTTYYYQVGDGTDAGWSAVRSFTISDSPNTSFFILGDIQTTNTANLARALQELSKQSYDFGLQTGDAIDQPNNYTDHWRPFLTTLNSETTKGVPVVHVMGNHEYQGDNGKISGAIYALPDSMQSGWYKVEYGNVCVVVVNNGSERAKVLAEIAQTLETDCIWRVLAIHVPVYGTDWTQTDPTAEEIQAIEAAGFDFVFSGDNQAYARTKPMFKGTASDDAQNGVVYYVCGDLSAKESNSYRTRDWFDASMQHSEYTGMYLTAEATEERLTIKTFKYDGTLLDSYTETRTNCELGKHKVDSTSKYDMTAGTITCAVCGTALNPEGEYAFSGLLSTTDGKQVILASGSVKKNEFSSFGERYHSCADGYAHRTTQSDSRTCVTAGYITYTCPACKQTNRSAIQRPVDHKWDANHKCTVCHTEGIDINSEDIVFKFGSPEKPRDIEPAPNYYYTGDGVRPGSFAKRGDYVLTQNNDANLINGQIPDLYVEWPDSKNVGKAEIKCSGRGNYYGDKTLTYYIVPNDVKNLALESATENSLTLTWNAAQGAEYYEVYKCDKDNKHQTYMGTTAQTTITVTGLKEDTEYYFVAAGRTKVPTEGNKVYTSAKWSNILCATTSPLSADVTAMTATVDGMKIPAVDVKGTYYLFLPASADLANLNVTITRSANDGSLVVAGNQSSQPVTGNAAALNVSALASETDGYRLLTAKVGNGKAFTVRVMQATILPTVYLTSTDASAKGRDYVDASKQNTTTAALRMIDANGGKIAATEITELKARGNSTFTYAGKKSYQIKLETPADLLQTGERVKTWVLLANYFDATLMHDKLFKDMAASLRMPYTASCDWVNLYYDGEYRGVYLLSEKNAVKDTGVAITDLEAKYRKQNPEYGTNMTTATGTNAYGESYTYTTGLTDPADITGGYLLELNHDAPDEVNGFVTKKGKGVNVKSPEWCSGKAMNYISEYYQAFENAVYATDGNGNYTGINEDGKHYYEYVDKDSLVKIFLMQELALNPDGFISSLYFYKDANGIMYAGPIWDQDMTLGTGWSKQISPDTTDYHYLAEALIQIPDFRAAVNSYYTEHFAPLAKKLIAENGTVSGYATRLTDSAAMNFVLWPYIRIGDRVNDGHIWQNATYVGVVADMQSWLTTRIAHLDRAFAGTVFEIGDVNMDGVVNAYDAVLILRYAASFVDDDFNLQYADIDRNRVVNSYDAVLLLRRVVGIED